MNLPYLPYYTVNSLRQKLYNYYHLLFLIFTCLPPLCPVPTFCYSMYTKCICWIMMESVMYICKDFHSLVKLSENLFPSSSRPSVNIVTAFQQLFKQYIKLLKQLLCWVVNKDKWIFSFLLDQFDSQWFFCFCFYYTSETTAWCWFIY